MDLFSDGHGLTSFERTCSGKRFIVARIQTVPQPPVASSHGCAPQGPCPPSGEHHYHFTLYAFGPSVSVPAGADKKAIDALAPQALATTELVGRFAQQ